jgi:hypothetical protein
MRLLSDAINDYHKLINLLWRICTTTNPWQILKDFKQQFVGNRHQDRVGFVHDCSNADYGHNRVTHMLWCSCMLHHLPISRFSYNRHTHTHGKTRKALSIMPCLPTTIPYLVGSTTPGRRHHVQDIGSPSCWVESAWAMF